MTRIVSHTVTRPARVSSRRVLAQVGIGLATAVSFTAACSRDSYAADTGHASARHVATSTVNADADVRALLAAARGAPRPLCLLAARAVNSWSWSNSAADAPRTPLSADSMMSTAFSDDEDASMGRPILSGESQTLLLNSLAAEDPCERELAVRLLTADRRAESAGPIADELAARLTVRGATAVNARTRETLVFGLGLLARARSAPVLQPLLTDTAIGVRANAAWALGRLSDGRALASLLSVARDREPLVRRAAVTAIGQIDSVSAATTLARVLREDRVADVRRVAAWALGQLRHGRDDDEDDDAERTVSAANRSADSRDAGPTRALVDALSRDEDARVREMSAWALGNRRATSAIDALIEAMRRDRSLRVRETSTWALGELRATRAADALGVIVGSDTSPAVRGTAAWALGQLHVRSAPDGLVSALGSPNDDLRLKASWALSEIRDPRTVPALQTALAKEVHSGARRAQLRGLMGAGERSTTYLSGLLQSPDAQTREAAVRALAGGRMVDPWPWPWPRPRPFP